MQRLVELRREIDRERIGRRGKLRVRIGSPDSGHGALKKTAQKQPVLEKSLHLHIIFGCSAPVVLRKVTEDTAPGAAPWSWKRTPYEYSLPRMRKDKAEEEAEEEEHSYERFQLVGECYVHGMMDGEAWKVPNIYLEIRKFTIV